MNDKPAADESGPSKEPSRDAASEGTQERTGTPYIGASGSQATRELRDTSRRRRESEEKLQQHLMEAREHAQERQTGEQQTGEQQTGEQQTGEQ